MDTTPDESKPVEETWEDIPDEIKELTPEEIRKAAQAGIVGTPLSRSLQAICHTSQSRSLTPFQASSRIRGA